MALASPQAASLPAATSEGAGPVPPSSIQSRKHGQLSAGLAHGNDNGLADSSNGAGWGDMECIPSPIERLMAPDNSVIHDEDLWGLLEGFSPAGGPGADGGLHVEAANVADSGVAPAVSNVEDALRFQMDMQRQLYESLEAQRRLQTKLDMNKECLKEIMKTSKVCSALQLRRTV